MSAVERCAVLLLGGVILSASDVTVGRGWLIDWRMVPSGEALLSDADTFDQAYLFVAMVGPAAAIEAVEARS